jgi:hypothetical protein
MWLRPALMLITLSTGGFMLVDGTRNLLTGTYFGARLGPWSQLVAGVSLDPHHLGSVFVGLGVAWFVALAGLLRRDPWGWSLAVLVGVCTLRYLPFGTALSLIYLALVTVKRRELGPADSSPGPSNLQGP